MSQRREIEPYTAARRGCTQPRVARARQASRASAHAGWPWRVGYGSLPLPFARAPGEVGPRGCRIGERAGENAGDRADGPRRTGGGSARGGAGADATRARQRRRARVGRASPDCGCDARRP